jgi:hypothetical protein
VPTLITLAEAAKLADRSKVTIHRWVTEGYVPVAFRAEGKNGVILLDEDHFKRILPGLLIEQEARNREKTLRPSTRIDLRTKAFRDKAKKEEPNDEG